MLMLLIESLDAGKEPVSLTAVSNGEEIMLRLYRQARRRLLGDLQPRS
jgi:hypothetical protein